MAEGTSSVKARSGGSSVFSLRCSQHPDAHLIEDYHAGDMVCPECGLVVGDRASDEECYPSDDERPCERTAGTGDSEVLSRESSASPAPLPPPVTGPLPPTVTRPLPLLPPVMCPLPPPITRPLPLPPPVTTPPITRPLPLPPPVSAPSATSRRRIGTTQRTATTPAIVIDVGSEWRTFSNERNATDRSRVGAAENPLLDGHELSSFIAPVTSRPGTNDSGKSFPKFTKSGVSAGDKSLMTAFKEIANMADRLNLPRSIVDRGNALFKQVNDEKTLKGKANDAIAAACLYIACRQEDVPRSFKEICAVSRHSKKEIGRCFKLIRQAANPTMSTVSTTDFMSRYCTNLGLPLPVQKAASYIAQKAVELDLAPGRVYLSVAAASIYMASQASDIKKTQKEVGDVVGVADSTIRQSYRLLYPSRHKLFPPDFKFDTSLDDLPKH